MADAIIIEAHDLKAEATANLHGAKAVAEAKDDADAHKAVAEAVTADVAR